MLGFSSSEAAQIAMQDIAYAAPPTKLRPLVPARDSHATSASVV